MPEQDALTPAHSKRDVGHAIERAWKLLGKLNALTPGDFDAMRTLLRELTGHEIDSSVRVLPPFHTDGGRNLRFGRNVFINMAAPRWTSAASTSAMT